MTSLQIAAITAFVQNTHLVGYTVQRGMKIECIKGTKLQTLDGKLHNTTIWRTRGGGEGGGHKNTADNLTFHSYLQRRLCKKVYI